MTKLWLALALALFAVGSSTLAVAEEPQKGDLIATSAGETFRSWTVITSALGLNHIPFVVFEKSGVYLISATEPVKRTATGGIEIERLKYVVKIVPKAGETVMDGFDCSFLGLHPAIAFLDETTKVATGYFATEEELLKRRWIIDDPDLCSYGGD